MTIKNIIETFDIWKEKENPVVLATVYETSGSTYSKAGQRIIINSEGDYQGLVSGGCLEGDIAERSNSVIKENKTEVITYDMRDDADDIFGLGVGCNGLLRIILQSLTPEKNYEPLNTINKVLYQESRGHEGLVKLLTIINSSKKGFFPGDNLIIDKNSEILYSSFSEHSQEKYLIEHEEFLLEEKSILKNSNSNEISVLCTPLVPIPKLLILGAGLDSLPIIDMASILGWRTTVVDHRPAYFEKNNFSNAEEILLLSSTKELSKKCKLGLFDAVVVMSHHLESDRIYLDQLKDIQLSYLGVLGPSDRKNRLIESIDKGKDNLKNKLKGPVGLSIGANSPETIALSLLAEIYTKIN